MGNLKWLIKDNPVLCAAGPPVWETALCHYLPCCVVIDKCRSGRLARRCTLSLFQAFNWACNYKWILKGKMSPAEQNQLCLCLPPLEPPANILTLKSFMDFYFLQRGLGHSSLISVCRLQIKEALISPPHIFIWTPLMSKRTRLHLKKGVSKASRHGLWLVPQFCQDFRRWAKIFCNRPIPGL